MIEPKATPRRRGRKPKNKAKIVELLKEYYQQYTAKECAEILGLSVNKVYYLLKTNNIRVESEKPDTKAGYPPQNKPLSTSIVARREQMERSIRQDYPASPTADIAEQCDANYYTVARNAIRMGVKKSKAYMRTRWASGSRRTLTDEERETMSEYLKAHFHDTKNEDLAKRFGVDVKTIRRYARRLGLQKSQEFMYNSRGKGRAGKSTYTAEYETWRIQRIAEVYPSGNEQQLQALQEELGLSMGGITALAYKNGIRRDKDAYYGKDLVAAVGEYFPTHTDKECAEHFGVKKYIIQNIARKYGFYKSTAHRERMFSSNITAAHTANAARRK